MKIEIMGILNINNDSFFEPSRITSDIACERIEAMIEQGADMIDIGALSSRPGSDGISEEAELERLKSVLDVVKERKFYERALFSLDSYSPLCLDYALFCGFKIVNDITALSDDNVCKIAAKHKAAVCIMHMKGTPKQMQLDPQYDDVVKEVDEFFSQRIDKVLKFGIEDIILDVGIGFGKKLEHNIALIKNHKHFLHFGYPLLVGASRKSMINDICPAPVSERLAGTLAVHLEAARNGASIIRCHDVREHVQAFRVFEALQ